jgi:nucleoside-diphosphate-sugar epimerase
MASIDERAPASWPGRDEVTLKVLVTGAAGFIGSRACRALLARGVEVFAGVRPGGALPVADVASQVNVVGLELANRDQVHAALANVVPDAILHLAWYAGPRDYLTSPRSIESLEHTVRLIEAAVTAGCPTMVAVGTCLEYGDTDRPRRETDPIVPESLYATCKHSAALIGRALTRGRGMRLTWARLFHMHGPGEHPDRLLPSVAAALKAGRRFQLSPGQQVRDFLHVDDIAAALALLVERGPDGAINVCSGLPVTLKEVVTDVASWTGGAERLDFGARPYADREPMYVVGDSEALRQLGWRPTFPNLRASFAYLGNQEQVA